MSRMVIERVPEFSFYVRRTLDAMAFGATEEEKIARLRAICESDYSREAMELQLSSIDEPEALNEAMRKLRRDVMLYLVAGDVTGRFGFDVVVRTVTELAELTLTHAVRVYSKVLARRFGVPMSSDGKPQDLMIVAMGKLGGGELNVSSDIDLVFVYDESGETRATPQFPDAYRFVSNHEFFERLAKRIISAINDVDYNGFVFRVDMRLRPFGDSGPIVVSQEMLEEYLYTEGRDWERFAWLKGRIVNRPVFSSDETFGRSVQSLYQLITPFVYRKYVDFSAISALSRIHEMIRVETVRREAGRDMGINVKLGRGGIREIEFITQTFQVMRGGRDKDLRGRSTLPMLEMLAKKGHLVQKTCQSLAADYVFLRNLEHALQYVDDRQTQVLGPEEEKVSGIAAMLGISVEELRGRLTQARENVSTQFDAIFHTEHVVQDAGGWPIGWQVGDETARGAIAERLSKHGFENSEHLARRTCRLLTSTHLRSSETRELFARFVQTVAQNAHRWAQLKDGAVSADEVFDRYVNLLDVISGRSTYVALLNQYPGAADKVGHLLAVSRWAADYLTEHPILLDELVDQRQLHSVNDGQEGWRLWAEELRRRLAALEGDQEAQLNELRDSHHGALFRLLMADIENELTVESLADQLSYLADEVLSIVIDLAWSTVPGRHKDYPKFAVIGYGKLGGKELGYASDLDLVFLYDDDADRALSNYTKLVRRMMTWLSAQTSSGILYEVDTRLRPNGADGLAATSLEAFRRYQRNEDGHGAWMWEHQALTRARFCAGDKAVGAEFEREREAILMARRDPVEVSRVVGEMREKMLQGHPNPSGLFDVKHDRGGMVDVEFIVQKLVLTYSHDYPELTKNLGNSRLLEMVSECGLIDSGLAHQVQNAYRRYRNIQRMIRLAQGEETKARVCADSVASERAAVLKLWQCVFATSA